MKKRTKGRVKKFEESRGIRTPEVERPKKRVRINTGRIALTVIVVLLIAVLGMSVKNIFQLQMENKELKEENKALTAEKESLQDEYENVSDTEYIEEQARIQLKLIKPGEVLYILEDQEKEDETEDEKED